MKTLLLIYIIAYISIAKVRAESAPVKTFSCQSVHSAFDSSYEQGDEVFVDIYLNKNGNMDVFASQVFGQSFSVFSNKKFTIDETATVVTTDGKHSDPYISMVFLGENNWGLYMKGNKSLEDSFLSKDIEVMCKQLEFSVI